MHAEHVLHPHFQFPSEGEGMELQGSLVRQDSLSSSNIPRAFRATLRKMRCNMVTVCMTGSYSRVYRSFVKTVSGVEEYCFLGSVTRIVIRCFPREVGFIHSRLRGVVRDRGGFLSVTWDLKDSLSPRPSISLRVRDESVRDSLREHDYIKGRAVMDWLFCTITSIYEEKYMEIEYGALS